MKNFALVGAAGFVAPRHLEAIAGTGNKLLAAMDKHDSVGILDRYFPEAQFFTEEEELQRFLKEEKAKGRALEYFSVCSPNHLHRKHVTIGLEQGATVICEKPLVTDPKEAEQLIKEEEKWGNSIFTILQLRLHPSIEKLRSAVPSSTTDIDLTYITPRGPWYSKSWKGKEEQSGGIPTNIGIHFFDMLISIFGSVKTSTLHLLTEKRAAGFLQLQRANVRWFLSIAAEDAKQNKGSYRGLRLDGKEFSFSEGFESLHLRSYEEILKGRGFGIQEALPSIELVHQLKTQKINLSCGEKHPLLTTFNI